MERREDDLQAPRGLGWLCALAVLSLCFCIGYAVLHVNLWNKSRYETPYGECCFYGWSLGWPIVYDGEFPETSGAFYWTGVRDTAVLPVVVDSMVAAMLVFSPLAVLRLRRSRRIRWGQWMLADVFSLTTASALVLSLLAVERVHNLAQPTQRELGAYSALRALPWHDQVAISIGILCTLYLVIAALSQMVRATAARSRRGPKN
jgi:hypothetical protein